MSGGGEELEEWGEKEEKESVWSYKTASQVWILEGKIK